jgi:hypothetical protein
MTMEVDSQPEMPEWVTSHPTTARALEVVSDAGRSLILRHAVEADKRLAEDNPPADVLSASNDELGETKSALSDDTLRSLAAGQLATVVDKALAIRDEAGRSELTQPDLFMAFDFFCPGFWPFC